MKKRFALFVLIGGLGFHVNGQSNIDSVLASIERNNKELQANRQYLEAQKLQFKTGLTPANPNVDFDYFVGSPSAAGNQTDFAVTQSFDFPTVYYWKKQLSNELVVYAELQMAGDRQALLLVAKTICIELVYRNKYHQELERWKRNTESLLKDFQKRLDEGNGTIINVNKARMQLIEINAEFTQNQSLIRQLNHRLTELNGGVAVEFSDTLFPVMPSIPTFQALVADIEANDPVRKYMAQQIVISQDQIALSRARSLPEIETGYRYQAILGQSFQGIHFGVTVPLWENKNTVKTQKANLSFAHLSLSGYLTEHYYQIMQEYERYQTLKVTLEDYQTVFGGLNHLPLLEKSFALGQISSIEFFLETRLYYESLKNYLAIEKEYFATIAGLYRHRL